MKSITIDAENMHYKILNDRIHEKLESYDEIIINNTCGQRYIGDAIKENVKIIINGTPGNDLAAFMDGPEIIVNGNVQDAVANTMNGGSVMVYGNAGDIVGYGMRGGRVYIKGDVGYRVGIHMKAFEDKLPVIIIGGIAKDFLGEYMAGGLLIVLGMGGENPPVGDFVGTGMHGGTIFIRTEEIDRRLLGKEVKAAKSDNHDKEVLRKYVMDYCNYFNLNSKEILKSNFVKLYPYTHRPYGRLYAY